MLEDLLDEDRLLCGCIVGATLGACSREKMGVLFFGAVRRSKCESFHTDQS